MATYCPISLLPFNELLPSRSWYYKLYLVVSLDRSKTQKEFSSRHNSLPAGGKPFGFILRKWVVHTKAGMHVQEVWVVTAYDIDILGVNYFH